MKLDTKEQNINSECKFCGMRLNKRYSRHPGGYRPQGRCLGSQVGLLHRPCFGDQEAHKAECSSLEYLERRRACDHAKLDSGYDIFFAAERDQDSENEPDSEPDEVP